MRTLRVLLFLTFTALLALAQDDPPSRVGRLTYTTGQISFRPGDLEDWVQADANRPLTTGDHLWTDEGARAEVQIGNAALRLNSRTAFEFLNLDDLHAQIRLAEGSLVVRLRSLADGESVEIDMPNIAFSLLRPGLYRIDVNPDRETTTVMVRGGAGEVAGDGQTFTVQAGDQAEISSGGDQLSYSVLRAPAPDEWDNWCSAQDNRETQSISARYVAPDMVGYQDLDDNGDWQSTPEYGDVWVPRAVAAGWAPYRYGHWIWVEPWGWTWVDEAPWGFAPFHYGRWVFVGHWAWVPGPRTVRPVYAPALVAWVGGPRFSLSVTGGGGVVGVGWFPLGPREVYVPAYRVSQTYVTRVNINYRVTNVYVNRLAPNAVTAVPQNTFGTTRHVQDTAVPVQRGTLQAADVINGAPVAPTRQSVLGYGPAGRVARPPAAALNRPVVAKTPPPPPAIPFQQRQQALSANPGHPLEPAQVQQLRNAQPPAARTFIRSAQAQPANIGSPTVPREERRNTQPEAAPVQQRREFQVQQPQPQLPRPQESEPRRENRVQQPALPPHQPDVEPRRENRVQQPPPPPQRQPEAEPRREIHVQQPPPPQHQQEVTPHREEHVARPEPQRPAAREERKEEKKEEKKDEKKDDKKKQ